MSLRVASVGTAPEPWEEAEDELQDGNASRVSDRLAPQGQNLPGLPPPEVSDPDADGVHTIVDYYVNEEGFVVRRTRRVRRRLERRRVCAAVAERRRRWCKFGLAATENANTTTQANEDIPIEWNTRSGEDGDPADNEGDAPGPAATGASAATDWNARPAGAGEELMTNKSIVVCRICGRVGDHWTLRCPYKGLQGPLGGLGATDSISQANTGSDITSMGMPGSTSVPSGAGGTAGVGGSSRYVPPSMRNGASTRLREGDSLYGRREENSIRISNLTEAATEDDLRQLLEPFGRVVRIYLARDKYTGAPKGFAFAAFAERSAAERCIAKLNGFGYDHLILSVEWARPSGERSVSTGATSSISAGLATSLSGGAAGPSTLP
jgi:translation initiation factor 3 subunit G